MPWNRFQHSQHEHRDSGDVALWIVLMLSLTAPWVMAL